MHQRFHCSGALSAASRDCPRWVQEKAVKGIKFTKGSPIRKLKPWSLYLLIFTQQEYLMLLLQLRLYLLQKFDPRLS